MSASADFIIYCCVDVVVNPRAILTGHEHPVICLAVSGSHGLVVSGSQGTSQDTFISL